MSSARYWFAQIDESCLSSHRRYCSTKFARSGYGPAWTVREWNPKRAWFRARADADPHNLVQPLWTWRSMTNLCILFGRLPPKNRIPPVSPRIISSHCTNTCEPIIQLNSKWSELFCILRCRTIIVHIPVQICNCHVWLSSGVIKKT